MCVYREGSVKSGTILENNKWKVKIYAPPKEHGPAHVHVIAKGENAEVKISLDTFEKIGNTKFSQQTVKKVIKYIDENFDELIQAWEELHEKN